jgi:hypothetical protein
MHFNRSMSVRKKQVNVYFVITLWSERRFPHTCSVYIIKHPCPYMLHLEFGQNNWARKLTSIIHHYMVTHRFVSCCYYLSKNVFCWYLLSWASLVLPENSFENHTNKYLMCGAKKRQLKSSGIVRNNNCNRKK